MARNKAEPCLFCGEAPCACAGSQKPKSTKPPKAKAPAKPSEPTSPSVGPDSATDDIFVATPTKSTPRFTKPATVEQQRDLTWESSLSALRSIVCPDDQKMIDRELAEARRNPLVEKQAAEWRRRNNRE